MVHTYRFKKFDFNNLFIFADVSTKRRQRGCHKSSHRTAKISHNIV